MKNLNFKRLMDSRRKQILKRRIKDASDFVESIKNNDIYLAYVLYKNPYLMKHFSDKRTIKIFSFDELYRKCVGITKDIKFDFENVNIQVSVYEFNNFVNYKIEWFGGNTECWIGFNFSNQILNGRNEVAMAIQNSLNSEF